MGTIDEAYVNNNNDNESSESEVINRTKYPTMIPSSVQNQSLTTSETVKGRLTATYILQVIINFVLTKVTYKSM